MAEPVPMIPYGSAAPMALTQQMTERVREAIAEGREVHVAGVVITRADAGHWQYRPFWSAMPREILAFAAYELDRQAKSDED